MTEEQVCFITSINENCKHKILRQIVPSAYSV